jgi:hypothetical protein
MGLMRLNKYRYGFVGISHSSAYIVPIKFSSVLSLHIVNKFNKLLFLQCCGSESETF